MATLHAHAGGAGCGGKKRGRGAIEPPRSASVVALDDSRFPVCAVLGRSWVTEIRLCAARSPVSHAQRIQRRPCVRGQPLSQIFPSLREYRWRILKITLILRRRVRKRPAFSRFRRLTARHRLPSRTNDHCPLTTAAHRPADHRPPTTDHWPLPTDH